jgi:tetratricopeptide (TPR) repeat protein
MEPDLQAAHRRLAFGLGISLSLLGIACLAAFLLLLRLYKQTVPRLQPTGAIAEALGWPWRDFPQITETERGTFLREIGLGRVFTGNQLPSVEESPSTPTLNDRLTTYLANPSFHACNQRPQKVPACNKLSRNTCFHRDISFCKTLRLAGEPFSKPYALLFHKFYSGDADAWDSEHLLWAITVAADIGSDVSSVDDPRLLANLGLLSARLGDFESAADFLDAAIVTSGNLGDIEEVNRMLQLAGIYSILGGRSVRGRVRDENEASSLRRAFWKLYQEDDIALRMEFPATGDDETRSVFDRWLFIRLWRRLLAEGDFERFTHEYDRLMREQGLFKDFFSQWRDEVLTNLGERALQAASNLERAGEKDRAHAIRVFLSDNTHFPTAIRSSARAAEGWQGWARWIGRRSSLWLVTSGLLLIVMLATIYYLGMIRLHRNTFFSFHHRERLETEV